MDVKTSSTSWPTSPAVPLIALASPGGIIRETYRIFKLLQGNRAPSDKTPKHGLPSPTQEEMQRNEAVINAIIERIATEPRTAIPPMWNRDP